jgi:hypothetical protein
VEKVKRVIFAVVFVVFCLPSSLAAANQPDLKAKAKVQLRVVTWKGQILVDRPVVARTTTVPTSRLAKCFGGKPTNGSVRVPGATATGALQRAISGVPGLRPKFTNAFPDFGLGLCAIGRYKPGPDGWWQLRVNGAETNTGGDQTHLERGDKVLWYLHKGGESLDELRLSVPPTVRRGASVTVRVRVANGAGKTRPIEGARIRAGGRFVGTTDARGRMNMPIRSRTRFVARKAGFIASNRSLVRVRAESPQRDKARGKN